MRTKMRSLRSDREACNGCAVVRLRG